MSTAAALAPSDHARTQPLCQPSTIPPPAPRPPQSHPHLDPLALRYLSGLAAAAIETARVRPGQRVTPDLPANTTSHTLIRPGGRDCYPAVWTQDFAMTLATGHVSPDEMWNHLALIATVQNGPAPRRLALSGALIPPYAIPDHVLFDGTPVYFPGAYSGGEDQGGEPWGLQPPANNHYEFILIAWHLWRATRDANFLHRPIAGLPLIDRLRLAFDVPRTDPETGLVCTDAASRAVGFIYCDSIYMTGRLLFASLLRWRAAHQLAELENALGLPPPPPRISSAQKFGTHITSVFGGPLRIGGWLMAATETGCQPDVWGTIYALHLGLLTGASARATLREIVNALDAGTIAHQGAIRHVPTNHDARPDSAWERTHTPHNHYQNGAYWHMPSGWLIDILAREHRDWSRRLFDDMIAHFRAEDFRQGSAYNAPWECIGKTDSTHPASAHRNPIFLGSVAVPCGVLCS
ncbi:hypothetical protein [Geminisphaera colitermitum]|uniref:hypothetical protein n=1 Tax=Geminisphaera colitermitum TaxID=1148786 RepID=UPI0005B941AC|nr:hypothetical protein [Geminisphaera colitermitum]